MLKINGKSVEFKNNYSFFDILSDFNFNEKYVLIEMNGEIIKKSDYSSFVSDNSTIEIVSFVGGG